MPNQSPRSFQDVTFKSAIKYAALPGIFPRLKSLADHVTRFFFMFIQIFGAIGLIDRNHPCLKPQNIGMYRFRDMIGLAASNVKYDREHLPQTIMFYVVILSFLMTVLMFVGFAAGALFYVHQSHAQFFSTPEGNGYSVDDKVNGDWALQFLYRVFGEVGGIVPEFEGYNPWFGALFMGMLRHYSFAMLVIAVFMILYMLLVTATEAARTGQPFGTRFDGIWAPIRLAMAIGLLIPVSGQGLNTAQLIVIQSSVWGSNLATNAWYAGIENMGSDNFFSASIADPGYRFVRDAFLINACIASLDSIAKGQGASWGGGDPVYTISYSGETMTITFGPKKASDFCGQVSLLILPERVPGPASGSGGSWPQRTAAAYQRIAFDLLPMTLPSGGTIPLTSTSIMDDIIMANNAQGPAVVSPVMSNLLNNMAARTIGENKSDYDYTELASGYGGDANLVHGWIKNNYRKYLGYGTFADGTKGFFAPNPVGGEDFTSAINAYNQWMVDSLVQDARYGWTTAGVFYIRLSAAMDTISKVVDNPPTVTQLPSVFTKYFASPNNPREGADTVRAKCNSGLEAAKSWLMFWTYTSCDKYKLSLKVNGFLQNSASWFATIVKNNPTVYSDLETQRFDEAIRLPDPESPMNVTGDIVTKPIKKYLFENFKIVTNLNPLGAVVSLGDGLMKAGIMSFAIGLIGGSIGLSSMANSLGTILITGGFVMMFWIPFMPFLYFTFGVIEWVVSVMEAVIGMPLWATTLITLEGDGLGKGIEGVKKIFEIVLRPTILVLSLLASVILFGASVNFVNKAISLYANASDEISSGILQNVATSIGLVVVYMFTIYLLAQSCFKLISAIPDGFMRWSGWNVQGFGGMIKMGPEGMSTLQSVLVGGAAIKGVSNVVKGAGRAVQGIASKLG